MNGIDSRLARAKFLIALDSDGSVFDTMDSRHRNAFVPALVSTYELEPIAGLVEEVWCFVNLQSRERGSNRFQGLVRTFEELHRHPILKRFPGVVEAILPDTRSVSSWVRRSDALSNENLESEIRRLRTLSSVRELGLSGNKELQDWISELEICLRWSRSVDTLSREHVGSADAFAGVYNFLRMLRPEGAPPIGERDDGPEQEYTIVVLSQSPQSLLDSQWNTAGYSRYVDGIFGQESGGKSAILSSFHEAGFTGQILCIGDAPNDLDAARNVDAWFFPIVPGQESASWLRLAYEGWPLFAAGCYNSEYQNRLVEEFFRNLPVQAPWDETTVRRVS